MLVVPEDLKSKLPAVLGLSVIWWGITIIHINGSTAIGYFALPSQLYPASTKPEQKEYERVAEIFSQHHGSLPLMAAWSFSPFCPVVMCPGAQESP